MKRVQAKTWAEIAKMIEENINSPSNLNRVVAQQMLKCMAENAQAMTNFSENAQFDIPAYALEEV